MDSKTFEVYRTSAGAGKTFAIVKEYILLCLQKRSRFDQIVALTFTNKAANEMKDRLLEYLFFIAHHPDAREDVREMILQISEETGMDASAISASSQQLLSDILHQYARFAISTIDSFIHDILRVFSNDLRLPNNFRVETDVSAVADAIVDELVHELEFSDQDPELSLLTAYIVELSLQNFEEKDSWDITRELKKYSKLLFSEDSIEVVENLSRCSLTEITEIARRLTKLEDDVYSRIRVFASEAMNVISEASLSTDDFFRKRDGIGVFFKRLSDASRGTRMNYNSYILQTVEQDKWESGKKNKVSTAVRNKLRELFFRITQDPMYHYLEMISHIKTRTVLMALLGKLRRVFDQYQKQNQVLVISEFIRLIAAVVRQESTPFIYERLGQRFRHFLIDEFQDTSVMQWQNFLPLIENALSQRNKVLVVGDVKQSIYRFRNGEMEQMMKLPLIYNKPEMVDHFNDTERAMIDQFCDRTKMPDFRNTNFRSGEFIVRFNNSHFFWIRDYYKLSGRNQYVTEAYNDLDQAFSEQAAESGMVCLYPVPDQEYREQALKKILQIISSHSRKSDIAILVRGNKTAREIASFLMHQQPPVSVISSESLTLGFSPHVCFIVDMLRFISDTSDQNAMIAAWTYLFNFSESIKNKFHSYSEWLNEVFLSAPDSQRPDCFISLLRDAGIHLDIQHLSRKPVDELIAAIIKLVFPNGDADTYLLFFQNKCIDFLKSSNGSLRSLIEWWDDKGNSECIIVPEGADAVRILSVHKSKGLQFPVVIYPFADFKLKDNNKSVWLPVHLFPDEIRDAIQNPNIRKIQIKLSMCQLLPDSELKQILENEIWKQELDSLNIHYVAMTRAKNELHILYKDIEDKSVPKDNYSHINEFLDGFVRYSESIMFDEVKDESGNIVYKFGKKSSYEKTQKAISEDLVLGKLISRDRSSIPTRGGTGEKVKEKLTGDLFHLLMSKFDFNVDPYIQFRQFCVINNIESDQEYVLRNMLNSILSHPQISNLFQSSGTYLNEVAIIDNHHTFRPDKIIFTQDTTWVIDFKTGLKHSFHRDQILQYKHLLHQMNYPAVKALLVYIKQNDVDVEEIS